MCLERGFADCGGLWQALMVLIVVYACMGCRREFRSVGDCRVHLSKSETAELSGASHQAGMMIIAFMITLGEIM